VLLHPTLIARVDQEGGESDISDFTGTVDSVQSMSMEMTFNHSRVSVLLTNNTVIEIDEIITTPSVPGFDLALLVSAGNRVEVAGTYDIADNRVSAAKIERKVEEGAEYQGIVVGLDSLSFDILILDPRDSGFEVGSIMRINYGTDTFFLFTAPTGIASADCLGLGQKARVSGAPHNPLLSRKIRLEETTLKGRLTGLGSNQNQAAIQVDKIEGVEVGVIPGFENPLQVEFKASMPPGLDIQERIELDGHFNRLTEGRFLVCGYENEEEGKRLEVSGKVFSLLSTAPLRIRLTVDSDEIEIEDDDEGDDDDEGEKTTTMTILLVENAAIIEKDKENHTSRVISAAELAEGIGAGRYQKLKAGGSYDRGSETLSADLVRADIGKAEKR
jgi:hypothetical protein